MDNSKVEYYCPPKSQSNLLNQILPQSINQVEPPVQSIHSVESLPSTLGAVHIIHNIISVKPQTKKEVISIAGGNTLQSFTLAIKNPILSVQNVEMSIKIDNTVYTDTLLSLYMLMQKGKGFIIQYYEDTTSIDIAIATSMHTSGSIFYMYITEPFYIDKNFVVTLNNTNAVSTVYDASLRVKDFYMVRGG